MDTLEVLKEFVKQRIDHPPENLNAESRLAEIGVDSLCLLELMFEMEEKFGLRVPNDLPQPETIGQLVDLFEKLRAPPAHG